MTPNEMDEVLNDCLKLESTSSIEALKARALIEIARQLRVIASWMEKAWGQV